MRVLLVEDDSSTAKAIELSLASEGIICDTTQLGEEGLGDPGADQSETGRPHAAQGGGKEGKNRLHKAKGDEEGDCHHHERYDQAGAQLLQMSGKGHPGVI